MGIKELLNEVETQDLEKRNLIIDSDSLCFQSCYKYKDEENNKEVIYADVFMRIKSIEMEIWKSYAIDKTVLALTSKKNFRHDLTAKWKQDRIKDESKMNDRQLEAHREAQKLRKLVSNTKALLATRMRSEANYSVVVNNTGEADDTVIDYANRLGYLVASLDSDVISQCPTPVFNYHKKHFKFEHEGLDNAEIFKGILRGSIMSHNGDFGIKRCGEVCTEKIIKQIEDGKLDLRGLVDKFDTPSDCLLNFRLSNCNQVIDGKLKLMSVQDIQDGIELLSVF